MTEICFLVSCVVLAGVTTVEMVEMPLIDNRELAAPRRMLFEFSKWRARQSAAL